MQSIELDSPIRVMVLLSEPIILEKERFISLYHREWKDNLLFEENPQWSDLTKGIQSYLVSDGFHCAILTYHSNSIPEGLIVRSLQLSNIKDSSEVMKYKGHTAYIDVHYAVSVGETFSLDKVRFINRLLHLFATIEETVGFINISAQLTRSRLDYFRMSKKADLNKAVLFHLFVSVQIEQGKEFWMHTHGMEQFELPDIECWYDNEKDGAYYYELIGNMALYMFDKGPILKVGHTFSMDGEEMFEIAKPKDVEGHEFGKDGAIRIKKRD